MKCLFNLYRTCRVLDILNKEIYTLDREKYTAVVDMYGKVEFLRNYCAFCIKSLYARRFKVVKYSVVNTL